MATKMTNNVEKTGRAAQQITGSVQQTGRIVSGYMVEAQEINTNFARKSTEVWIEAFRRQAELNQRVAQRLYDTVERQTSTFEDLGKGWMGATPFFNPFDSGFFGLYREGFDKAVRNVERMTEMTQDTVEDAAANANGKFPISGYDEMSVADVTDKLDKLSVDELRQVRSYERRTKSRETLIDRIDRKIKAASA